jgi:hypothetical protein
VINIDTIIGITVYLIVVAISFILGRCYQIGKEECKRMHEMNMKGYSPTYSRPPRLGKGYQPNKIKEPLYEAPNTGSGIKPTPPPIKTVKNG